MPKTPSSVHMGSVLRDLRRQAGLTMAQVGEKVGMPHQQIQRYESGLNAMSASTLYCLSQALGCDVRRFYDGLEENPEIERTHNLHWTTLEMAERLDALPDGQLKDGLKLVLSALSNGESSTRQS
ncbi:helix-turn-helix domain-containing protein [Aureimonas pseudogalii]|uniref:Transcriptional regulator with XRE-family HTH domain n=1 Tax=Aureimonas pseudogalii TaxID=1744844 RepID=A0A7W6E8S3_9HYPH|nr:helix-turn-helix transcriptional regulator [Aureimonas pseudogalii]MBB3996847.1 transcriptional regulator with XRE-family HTH domain [Aureimonas pseudogalii]